MFALIVIGFLVLCFPPSLPFVGVGLDGGAIRNTKEQADGTTPFFVLVVGGLVLLGFVLKGLRVTKITTGTVSAEVKDPGEAAEDY